MRITRGCYEGAVGKVTAIFPRGQYATVRIRRSDGTKTNINIAMASLEVA